VVTAPAKRSLVRILQDKGLSGRRALRAADERLGAALLPRPDANVELREQIIELAQRHRRYGSEMIT
jgi:putative transposase